METCECGKEFKNWQARCGHQAHCGKEVDTKECPICSRKISIYGYPNHLKSHEGDTKCPNCDEVVAGKGNKYCNHSCSAAYNNKGVVRNGSPAANCLNCKKKLRASISKYCSHNCHQDYRWKAFVEEIEKIGDFPEGASVYKIKKYFLKEHKRRCWICELKEWMGKEIPLELDHIDGNSENNLKNNFRLVCGNCAMQLPTYKAKNKGNGRHTRRERYRAGKSY